MLPKSSMAASCLTRTFFFVIRRAPWASVTVMIIGIISGVIPTASATEKRNDSSSGRWKTMLTSRTNSTSSMITRVIISPKWRMPRPNSVSGGRMRQALGDLAEGGISAGADDDRGADPCLDGGAQEDAVARVGNAVLPRWQITAPSSRRASDSPVSADSRTCRSFDLQQTGVRRHKVSGIEPDDVARDQFRDRQFLFSPVAHHGGRGGDLLPNLLHRMPSLELHEEVQQHAEQDHRDDDQSADRVAERER